jgi:hypothetical protein
VRCSSSRGLALGLLAALVACGPLPRPFAGHPGATARLLARPPPARLDVPPPTGALLGDAAAATYQTAVASALQAEEVPAVADIARVGDWRLVATAERRGDKVVPLFTVADPDGTARGTAEGAPIDAAAWSAGQAETLRKAAAAGAPAIASLLTRIEAARRMSDPNSLVNRPARVYVADVTGAPGDGDRQLARDLRQQMPTMGEVALDTATDADFTVRGEVRTTPGPSGAERVEIQWIVSDAQGREAGRIVQLNDVATGSLDHYWGDTAVAVAQEAASGVRDVIQNQLGARAAAKPAATPPGAPDKPAAGSGS